MKWMKRIAGIAVLAAVVAPPALGASETTYEKDIRPIVAARCTVCHGPDAPAMEEFGRDKERYKSKKKGPRLDTYPHLLVVVKGSDAGALMRRLDDGNNTRDAGKRPRCALHAAARSAQFSFLATAAIGQPNALSGLVVMADTHAPAPDFILPLAQLLATTIKSILQRQSKIGQLQSELEAQEPQISILETLEMNMREGVFILDPALRILRINRSAETMLGYTNREVKGQAIKGLDRHRSAHASPDCCPAEQPYL